MKKRGFFCYSDIDLSLLKMHFNLLPIWLVYFIILTFVHIKLLSEIILWKFDINILYISYINILCTYLHKYLP